jgi:hypothetical protein
MKAEPADGQNRSTQMQWQRVPKIASEAFQQSYAVAQLALKLCELERANPTVKQQDKCSLRPEKFLEEAWKLIDKARDRVLRSETDDEYLARHGGSLEAGKVVVGRILPNVRIPFQRLCDSGRNEGDSEQIRVSYPDTGRHEEIDWKVLISEKGFDKLFSRYWDATGVIPRPTRGLLYMRATIRQEYGAKLLASWKRDGVPVADLLALARFRREGDKRTLNLTKTSKQKQLDALGARAWNQ